jgi:hypothetical protein
MKLTPGTRLRSAVCGTEGVVVRVPGEGVPACCGVAMLPIAEARPEGAAPDPAFAGGSQVGKRYYDEQSGLEMLCTKPGAGTLSIGGRPLQLRETKQLPSSD